MMDEEGDVLADGSALVNVEEELGNLHNSTTALTQMNEMALQRMDVMASAQRDSVDRTLL